MRCIWTLLACSIIGCASPSIKPPPPPPTQAIVLSANLAHGAPGWVAEAKTQLTDPLVVLVHGIEEDGVWMAAPDRGPLIPVEGMARLLRKVYPNRSVVLVTCNEMAADLKVAGVWYGRGIVSSRPHAMPEWCDSILEMVEGRE